MADQTTQSKPPMAYVGPTGIGPAVRLPGLRLAVASVLGAGVAALPAWAIIRGLRPDDLNAILPACAAAATAHLVALLVERPWRVQRLGQWPFTILHASMISLLVVLASIVLLYSSSSLGAVALSLVAAGAWTTGFLVKVLVFGRFAKAVEAGLIPPDGAADAGS